MPVCPSKLARSRNWGTLAATDWSHRASTLSTPRIRVRDAAWSPLLRAANERSCSTTSLRRPRSFAAAPCRERTQLLHHISPPPPFDPPLRQQREGQRAQH